MFLCVLEEKIKVKIGNGVFKKKTEIIAMPA